MDAAASAASRERMNEPWTEFELDLRLARQDMWLPLLRWVAHRTMAHALAATVSGQRAWHPVDAVLFWVRNWPWGYSQEQRMLFHASYLDRHAIMQRERQQSRPEAAPLRASGGVRPHGKRRKKRGRR